MLSVRGVCVRFSSNGRLVRPFVVRAPLPPLALDHVSLELPAGRVVALLGPNGAGKTTLMRCCAGVLLPHRGEIRLDGELLTLARADLRARIGFVVRDERSFHQRLTGRQNLEFFARLHRLDRNERRQRIELALDVATLADDADRPYRAYSTGMKQRLSMARALLGRPDVLLMDEATSGLDPGLRATFHASLQRWVSEHGSAVLYATHDMEEARRLSEDVVVLERGTLVARGAFETIRDDVARVFGGIDL